MSDEGQVSKRRVYDLPIELVDRINAFQTERKLPSEVEAVRRLLDEALKYRDTADMIIDRFKERLKSDGIPSSVARDVLVGHPLVRSIIQDELDLIIFTMKDGSTFRIHANGSSEIQDESSYDNWSPYPYQPKALEKKSDYDDEIPF